MPTLDVFSADCFSMMSLTAAVNKLPHKPQLIGDMNLFQEVPVRTRSVFVEEQRGKLSVLARAGVGSFENIRSRPDRVTTNFIVPHFPQFQTVLAEDVQGLRPFGQETELQAVAAYVNDQLQGMVDNHDVTQEYHRIGAITGNVLDSDGATSIYNLFTEFGMTQVVIHFDYDTVTNYGLLCTTIIRQIADQLGGTSYGQIYALCGNNYFDAVVSHSSVRTAYDRWLNGEMYRVSQLGPEWYALATNGLMFQNIMFINYRGTIGSLTFLADDDAYFFASGVPGLFQEIVAPADFMETVNTRGQRVYAKQKMLDYNKGVELHTQHNILSICTRPSSVIKSTVCDFTGEGTGTGSCA
jgi:hypothetical protein